MNQKKQPIYQEAEKIADLIAQKYQPEKIILFGSIAEGKITSDSDIDLLVVKKTNKKRAFRIMEVFRAVRDLRRNFALDPIVYTPEELENRLTIGDYFVNEALKNGEVLYG